MERAIDEKRSYTVQMTHSGAGFIPAVTPTPSIEARSAADCRQPAGGIR